MKNICQAFSFLFFALLLMNCTRNPPEIQGKLWQLNVFNDIERDIVYERLSFFIRAYDEDGFDDIDKIFIVNDNKELFWEVSHTLWYEANWEGETWIGSNSIFMNDFSNFPRGEYRIILQDIGGESVESYFLLDSVEMEYIEIKFPEPEVKDEIINIAGEAEVYSLWIYDRKWDLISTPQQVTKNGFSIKSIIYRYKELSKGFYYYIYVFANSLNRGLLSGPYFYYLRAN